MSDWHRPIVRALGFCVIRAPLLPMQRVFAVDGEEGAARAAYRRGGLAAPVLDACRRQTLERMQSLASEPIVSDALFVASTEFHARLDIATRSAEERVRQELALYRYLSRMSARSTPFGLCSGVGLAAVSGRTQLRLGDHRGWRQHVRIDAAVLDGIAQRFRADRSIRESVRFGANDTIRVVAATLEYVEVRPSDSGERGFVTVAVEATEPIRAILERVGRGDMRFSELHALVLDLGATAAEATAFVHEMVDAQLLVPRIDPHLTGLDPLDGLLLDLADVSTPEVEALRAIASECRRLSAESPGALAPALRDMSRRVLELAPGTDPRRMFHVDLHLAVEDACLDVALANRIGRAALLMRAIAKGQNRDDGSTGLTLGSLRQAFERRFGEAEVPLLDLFAENGGINWAGIGEGQDHASLHSELALPEPVSEGRASDVLLRLFGKRFGDSRIDPSNTHSIDLDASAVADLTASVAPPRVAETIMVVAKLANAGGTLGGPQLSVQLRSVGGASGASWIGRFCHGNPRLAEAARAMLRVEESQHPERIFAEVVHLPHARFANFISRPVLREYEIAFLGRSGVDHEGRLALSDLVVSVREGRMQLRSRRLGVEVVPRIASAHNGDAPTNLPLYRFLWLLQWQESGGGQWSWGALENQSFLPRVTHDGIILSLARWRLDRSASAALDHPDAEGRYAACQRLRDDIGLPRFVALVEGDNELALDLDDPIAVETLAARLRQTAGAILSELFPAPGDAAVGSSTGAHVCEVVLPFAISPQASVARPRSVAGGDASLASVRKGIGSDWLYVKWYCGRSAADRLLHEHVWPMVEELASAGAIDNWFFIRYGDPDFHVRLRLHGAPAELWSHALRSVVSRTQFLEERGFVSSTQLDTYLREVDRYGGSEVMSDVERLFGIDSTLVARLLPATAQVEDADRRWQVALFGILRLLEDLRLPLDQRIAILRSASSGSDRWQPEQRRVVRQRTAAGFRQWRARLERLVLERRAPDDWPGEIHEAFDVRSAAIADLLARPSNPALPGTLRRADVAGSLIHMHLNRIHLNPLPYHEYTAYEFGTRLLQSALARGGARARDEGLDPVTVQEVS